MEDLSTIVLFDYDDTLLASTDLQNKQYKLSGPTPFETGDHQLQKLLDDQAEASRQLLLKVIELLFPSNKDKCLQGKNAIYIVTNSEATWVERSAAKFAPSLFGELGVSGRVRILSARSIYEEQYPNDQLRWKQCAFEQAITETLGPQAWSRARAECKDNSPVAGPVPGPGPTPVHVHVHVPHSCNIQVVSIGDSQIEHTALIKLTHQQPHICTKTIKVLERPSVACLTRQLRILHPFMEGFLSGRASLNVRVRTVANAPPQEKQSRASETEAKGTVEADVG